MSIRLLEVGDYETADKMRGGGAVLGASLSSSLQDIAYISAMSEDGGMSDVEIVPSHGALCTADRPTWNLSVYSSMHEAATVSETYFFDARFPRFAGALGALHRPRVVVLEVAVRETDEPPGLVQSCSPVGAASTSPGEPPGQGEDEPAEHEREDEVEQVDRVGFGSSRRRKLFPATKICWRGIHRANKLSKFQRHLMSTSVVKMSAM